eukprot:IDg7071t1
MDCWQGFEYENFHEELRSEISPAEEERVHPRADTEEISDSADFIEISDNDALLNKAGDPI